jgi:hypothetical protein
MVDTPLRDTRFIEPANLDELQKQLLDIIADGEGPSSVQIIIKLIHLVEILKNDT